MSPVYVGHNDYYAGTRYKMSTNRSKSRANEYHSALHDQCCRVMTTSQCMRIYNARCPIRGYIHVKSRHQGTGTSFMPQDYCTHKTGQLKRAILAIFTIDPGHQHKLNTL
eukprot:282354-Pelagomonas_calceolata.AAC.8